MKVNKKRIIKFFGWPISLNIFACQMNKNVCKIHKNVKALLTHIRFAVEFNTI